MTLPGILDVTSLLSTNKMEQTTNADVKFDTKYRFKDRTNLELNEILKGKDKVSTQRATNIYMKQFATFLAAKSLPTVDNLDIDSSLDNILADFYASVQPQKKDDYSVQTLKCIRSGLNRYFRQHRGIDIAKNPMFVRANEMLKAVQVDAKKKGQGVKNSTPPISEIDLERIAEYFCHDHISLPDPRRLQQNIIFYIIYFFCRRGRENLYTMTTSTYKYQVHPDGTEYFIQDKDEMDKNHGIDDDIPANQGKMYGTNGEKIALIYLKNKPK